MRLKSLAKPLFIRRVSGDSMSPTLRAGELVLVCSALKPKIGDVIVFRHNDLEKIKRIESIDNGYFFVVGDNKDLSTDSRVFGKLSKDLYKGSVILPRTKKVVSLI